MGFEEIELADINKQESLLDFVLQLKIQKNLTKKLFLV